MFMEAGAVITYSLYAPADLVQGMSFADSYAFLDEWVIVALKSLGIDATYQPLNDITSPTGKIGGAAQKRLGNGAVLHHVTMSYDMDGEKMVRGAAHRPREDQRQGHQERGQARRPAAQPDRPQPRRDHRPDEGDLHRRSTASTPGEITPEEYAAAEKLVAEKFGTEEWLYRVP